MEPVTHLLTGACLARTGFHRRVAYATAAMAVAAEFPDVDTLWSLRGPVAGFKHHRGLTHTLLGVPFEAAFLLLSFFLLHRWRRRSVSGPGRAGARAPEVRWAALYGLLLLALLSHLLLDYTNNYGLRPFAPFNPRWYAGSIVFIFDPLIFVLLLAGLLLPALFGLVNRELGARRQPTHGGWARAALVGVVLLWGIRTYEHDQAVTLAQDTTVRAAATQPRADELPPGAAVPDAADAAPASGEPAPEEIGPSLQARRSLASPDPLSVFRWYTVTDFGPLYRLGTVDSRMGTLDPGPRLAKPDPSSVLSAAERSPLGRVYLDWSPMPVLRVEDLRVEDRSAQGEAFPEPGSAHRVWFSDPRFMGDSTFLHRDGTTPLTGVVMLGPSNRVLAEGMDGRFGR